jgi:hypothetical protein
MVPFGLVRFASTLHFPETMPDRPPKPVAESILFHQLVLPPKSEQTYCPDELSFWHPHIFQTHFM